VDDAVEGGGVALQLDLELQLAAGDHYRHAVVADRAGDDHLVTGADRAGAEDVLVLDHADARGVDVEAVGLAAFDDLGVAGGDSHVGGVGGGAHGGGDPLQVGDRQALFDDEAGGEGERGRAGHRQVVDGAVDGELADVATGEEEGADDEGVGGEGELVLAGADQGRVAERVEQLVGELAQEDPLDQVVGGLAAGTVAQGDALVEDLAARAAPARLDRVEDLLLGAAAVGLGGHATASLRRPAWRP
jgi:hypothetical protein